MPNRLAQETSPYLQQHAENPVDWYPWGEEALTLARTLDKPILLSVGYSACHWCHVMAHESFEDEGVAASMNDLFVNIKVDREERPDLDQIYQAAHHLLARRNGGWPLTMFLTPDGKPFAGGTYFPKTPRHGMPGFTDLLVRIEAVYRGKRAEIEQQNASMVQALAAHVPQATEVAMLGVHPLAQATQALTRTFDPTHGGLGRAPKFPHPYEFDFLLRQHAAGETGCLDMVTKTLSQMARGGVFDQLGGGFCRYSVDDEWTIPHFEKMLYDNGPLLALYSDAYRATGTTTFATVATATAHWVMREMQALDGGYFSSLDADSEHEEGKFYVWTPEQIRARLTPDEFDVVAPYYGLDATPNFEHSQWHLRITQPLDVVARHTHRDMRECEALLNSARTKLLAERETRIRPARDEKILTSWNALMIRGMVRAGRLLQRPDWIESARRALDFIATTMWRDGRLLATHKAGKTHLNAYLDDYAFLLDALIEMLQADFRTEDLQFAQAVADALLEWFEDPADGGFFFTSHDHERLIQRPKPGFDNATPAGNGIAAYALQRLGYILGEPRYLAAAERTLALYWPQLEEHPQALPSLLAALAEHMNPPRVVVFRGPEVEVSGQHDELSAHYLPTTLVLAVPNGLPGLPAALSHPEPEHVNAWICEGVKCLPPLSGREAVTRLLANSGRG